jgi:hypothetical protein
MTGSAALDAYIRKETYISVAINAVMSLLIFLAVFDVRRPVQTWGMGQWVFDFLPQSFMITLMTVLVPGALARQKLRSGTLAPAPHQSILPRNLVLRAVTMAVASAIIGTAIVASLVWLMGTEAITPTYAAILKVAYGTALALIVAPLSLRVALAS